MAANLIEHEIQWLPELAPVLPFPIPEPVRIGRPGADYPWSWVVTRFVPGAAIGADDLPHGPDRADDLVRFLDALHRPAPPDAPTNPVRGCPLAERHPVTTARLDELADLVDGAACRRVWDDALTARPWTGRPLWVHGDLHPLNILHQDGRLSGVVDFGDLTAGDPATDLVAVWNLFDRAERDRVRSTLGTDLRPSDDDLWARGRGWALSIALAILDIVPGHPRLRPMADRTLERLVTDR